jgi:hypothetical protein
MPFNYAPYSLNGKYIYIARNPYDICISNYNFLIQAPGFNFKNATFDDFFENFMNDKMSFGGYFDHLNSWYSQKNNKNILFLTYEEMKIDLRKAVIKIAEFMGKEYLNKILENNNEMLEKILVYMHFDYMKRLKFIVPSSGEVVNKTGILDVGDNEEMVKNENYSYIDFFKNGKSGYGQQLFTNEQKVRLSQKIKDKLMNENCSELLKTWENCGIKLFY